MVSPPFESHPLFFYPTPRERVIHSQDKSQLALDTRRADVTLAEIPFVRLRERILPNRLLEGTASYSEAVAAAQRALNGGELVIDYDERCVTAGQVTFRLPSSQLAFLGWFARRHRQGLPPLPRPWEEVPDSTLSKEFLTELEHVYGRDHVPPETRRALANGMDCAYFDQTKSKLTGLLSGTCKPGPSGSKF